MATLPKFVAGNTLVFVLCVVACLLVVGLRPCPSVTSITMTVFFYLLRPKEKAVFEQWWPRGRWVLLFIFVASAACIIGALSISIDIVTSQWFVTLTPESLCDVLSKQGDAYARYREAMIGGLGFLGFFTLLSVVLMF